MKFILLIFILVANFTFSQKFYEIRPNDTKYKFPVLEFKSNAIVEEKINSYLQIKYLEQLDDEFEDNPFFKVVSSVNNTEFISWKQFHYNSNVIGVNLVGNSYHQKFDIKVLFDLRTGDFFTLNDLFINNIEDSYIAELQKKVIKLVDNGTLPPNPNIKLDIDLMDDSLQILILKTETKSIKIAYTSLNSQLTEYGENLLLTKSEKVIRRPDMANKILKDTAWNQKGSIYERQIQFKILILNIEENGQAEIYYWSNKYKKITTYTEAIVKDQKIEADIYVWDSLMKEKVKLRYGLKLNKQTNNLWEGSIESGSPIYPVKFFEY